MGLSIHKFHINLQLLTGVILGVSLLAGGAYFLHPFSTDSTHAANTDVSVSYTGSDWTVSAPTSTAASAGGLDFDITSSSSGVNVAKKDTVTSGTTNVPDYQIYVSVNTADGKMPATSGSTYIGATTGTSASPAALSNNSWGFALSSFNTGINYNDLVSSSTSSSWSSSKWAKLPYVATASVEDESTIESDATKIYDSTSSSGGAVDVYYAIKANNDLASGDYATTVTYTLIGDVPAPAVTYMQNMDAAACAALDDFSTSDVTGTTYEVVDKRDDQPYYIRKFTFGSSKYCTMVENLNLQGGTTVTYEDTNITSSTTTYLPGSGSSATGTYTLPTSTTSGYTSSDTTNASQKMYNGNGRNRNGATYSSNAVDGAYYQWQVATAGTGGPYNTSRASAGDICPKNWRLFTSSERSNINSAINSTYGINNWYTKNDGTAAAASAPVYSGGLNRSSLSNAGSLGTWWSSTRYDSDYAFSIYAYSGSLYTDGNDKYGGFSVRCLLPSS